VAGRSASKALNWGDDGNSEEAAMEYRSLGRSGLKVPALSFGAGTFGGSGPLFGAWGNSDPREARRLVDICLEAGVNLFDTADVYSNGASEEVLGSAIKGRRDAVLLSTKTSLPMGEGPNEAGSSRLRLVRSVEDALVRLGTDYLDLLQLHAFDAGTPVEEVLATLDVLVRAGKVRYVGVSNFSGWQIMKSLAVADRYGWPPTSPTRCTTHSSAVISSGSSCRSGWIKGWELWSGARPAGVV
jgi:aryl-alcohol dehydrogenase-like predicted oxidoreductase